MKILRCMKLKGVEVRPYQTKEDILKQEDEDDPTMLDPLSGMQRFFGGDFRLGINDPKFKEIGEYPVRNGFVKPFKMDRYPVTNAQFENFLNIRSSFLTDPELRGWSYVFFNAIPVTVPWDTSMSKLEEEWWIAIKGATWREPEGPGSNIGDKDNYPVVHVSFHDALAFCHWSGKRLPTELEWEFAARDNPHGFTYPWGDTFRRQSMNYWQGFFPAKNDVEDGWEFVSPVDAYPAQNERGMYDMVGNVWEWTSTFFRTLNMTREVYQSMKVVKGGSFVDTREGDYNSPVRTSTRRGFSTEYSAQNVGFRCAKDWNIEVPEDLPEPEPFEPKYHRLEDTWAYKQEQIERAKKMKKLKANIERKKHQQILRMEEL